MKKLRILLTALVLSATALFSTSALAADASSIDAAAKRGLNQLLSNNPEARALASQAEAVLVFPKIVKAGFLVGGSFGEGALIEDGRTIGYFSSTAASYGYQAGVEEYGYAIFFMDDDSLSFLKRSRGWALGAGPSVTVLNKGFSKNLSTTSLQNGVYAVFFGQQGLMAGVGLQGSKIQRIFPN